MKKIILKTLSLGIIASLSFSTAFAAVKVVVTTPGLDLSSKQFRGKITDFTYTTHTWYGMGKAPMIFLTVKDKNNKIVQVEFTDEDVRMGEALIAHYDKYVLVNVASNGDVDSIGTSYPN